jgi:hypothetical protein
LYCFFFSKIELRSELQTQKKTVVEGIRNRPISAENRTTAKILDRILLKNGTFLTKKMGTNACMHFFQKNRVTWYTSESKEANSTGVGREVGPSPKILDHFGLQ